MINHISKIAIIFLFLSTPCFAFDENNYWQCSSHDSEDNQWIAKSQYERTAVNKAFEACKKSSRNPSSCQTAKEMCMSIINGVNTQAMWQCTALDQMAKHWASDIYVHRDDAALGAKAHCEQRSAMPMSCYINLMTCKNLNEK